MGRMSTLAVLACLALLPLSAVSAEVQGKGDEPSAPQVQQGSPEATWGVRAVALRPTFGGRMLDFRYQVLDPAKAKPLFDWKIKPYLFDLKRGVALGLPGDTSIGALRASVKNPPVAGKQYFVLFSNAYGSVKKGDRVTVVLGDCKFSDVVVE
jgi:hypothetical protein